MDWLWHDRSWREWGADGWALVVALVVALLAEWRYFNGKLRQARAQLDQRISSRVDQTLPDLIDSRVAAAVATEMSTRLEHADRVRHNADAALQRADEAQTKAANVAAGVPAVEAQLSSLHGRMDKLEGSVADVRATLRTMRRIEEMALPLVGPDWQQRAKAACAAEDADDRRAIVLALGYDLCGHSRRIIGKAAVELPVATVRQWGVEFDDFLQTFAHLSGTSTSDRARLQHEFEMEVARLCIAEVCDEVCNLSDTTKHQNLLASVGRICLRRTIIYLNDLLPDDAIGY